MWWCAACPPADNSVIRSADRFPAASSHSESSDYCRPRLRLAIHPVDCAPVARTLRLRGDPAVRYTPREDPRTPSGWHHPLGWTEECLRHWRPALRHGDLRVRRAGAGDLLRDAADDARP